MGVFNDFLKTVVARKSDVDAAGGLDAYNAKKAAPTKDQRQSLLTATEGGDQGQELSAEQVKKRDTLLGN